MCNWKVIYVIIKPTHLDAAAEVEEDNGGDSYQLAQQNKRLHSLVRRPIMFQGVPDVINNLIWLVKK